MGGPLQCALNFSAAYPSPAPGGVRRDDEITGTKHSRDQFDNFGGCENFELHKRSVVACRRPPPVAVMVCVVAVVVVTLAR